MKLTENPRSQETIQKLIKEAFDLVDQFIDNDRAQEVSIEMSPDIFEFLKENGLNVSETTKNKPVFRKAIDIKITEDRSKHLFIKYEPPLEFSLEAVLEAFEK